MAYTPRLDYATNTQVTSTDLIRIETGIDEAHDLIAAGPGVGSVGSEELLDGAVTPAKVGTWPACKASVPAVNFDAPNGALGIPNLTVEDFDTDGMHDPTVNPDRLTINRAGLWRCDMNVVFPPNTTGIRIAYIKRNAGDTDLIDSRDANDVVGTYVAVGGVLKLAVGDYLQAQVYQDSGVALAAAVSLAAVWMGKG